jgi:hypothetical protein
MTSHRYPLDIDQSDRAHKIIFHICVQAKSSYKTTWAAINTGMLSTADVNRAHIGATQLGSAGTANTQAYGGGAGGGSLGQSGQVVAALLGGAAGGAIGGALGEMVGGGVGGLAGAVIGGAAGAATGMALVKQLDLTRKTTRLSTTISMYMPDNIQVKYAHNFDAISMTEALGKLGMGAQVGASIVDAISGNKSGDKTAGSGDQAVGISSDPSMGGVTEAIGMAMESSGVVGEGFKDVALFSAGLALNPQFEMVFKSTPNRDFQFDFKFVPRNLEEAKEVLAIIQTFRFHAAPEIAAAGIGRYLVPPSEFDIEFYYKNAPNNNIPKISTCVLESIDVNYTSAGSWTTFDGGIPVEIYMQLNFKEVEMIHKALVEAGY